jgi:hypothetical protein
MVRIDAETSVVFRSAKGANATVINVLILMQSAFFAAMTLRIPLDRRSEGSDEGKKRGVACGL